MVDFAFEIHRMTPSPKSYNVLRTDMEGTRIKRRLKSSAAPRKWTVEIRGRTNAEADLIIAHYDGQTGPLTPFNWIVPTFFGGQTFYVTYEEFDLENPDGMGNVWDFHIVFAEEIP